jgi:hypothetical protein
VTEEDTCEQENGKKRRVFFHFFDYGKSKAAPRDDANVFMELLSPLRLGRASGCRN